MADERRYDDEEVAEIFRVATSERTGASGADPGRSDGLTLGELHAIAREVGIPAEVVTRAAGRVGARSRSGTRSVFGVPVGVDREVSLEREPTDSEWARLVARFRETFRATGRTETAPGLRQWWNGNLRITVESTGDGARLRMTTRKGDLRPVMAAGGGLTSLSLVLLLIGFGSGNMDPVAAILPGLMGLAAIGWNLVRMPLWARTRAGQMETLADEVAGLTALPAPRAASKLPAAPEPSPTHDSEPGSFDT